MNFEDIARVAHEANRMYCLAIGDNTQVPWIDAPQWQKDSAIAGVDMYAENPATTPEESHASWMRVKESEGWVYGPKKDFEKKTHPCMVPYDQLPREQRAKDYIFGAVVANLLSMTAPKPIESTPTEGEWLVGIGFNPSGNRHVDRIKRGVADLIDYVHEHGKDGRCTSICAHQLEDAAMWGVKSVTKRPRK